MRVKVNNFWFNGSENLIMTELTEQDRKNITGMKGNLYATHPEGMDPRVIEQWMKEGARIEAPDPKEIKKAKKKVEKKKKAEAKNTKKKAKAKKK